MPVATYILHIADIQSLPVKFSNGMFKSSSSDKIVHSEDLTNLCYKAHVNDSKFAYMCITLSALC